MIKFISSTTPKARKVKICGGCGGRIEIGEKHHVHKYSVDGDIESFNYHNHCNEIINSEKFRNHITEIYTEGFTEDDFNDFVNHWYVNEYDGGEKVDTSNELALLYYHTVIDGN